MKRVTADLIKSKGACAAQYKRFKRYFPNGVNVTVRNIERAMKLDFPIMWASEKLLDRRARDKFNLAKDGAWGVRKRGERRSHEKRRAAIDAVQEKAGAVLRDSENNDEIVKALNARDKVIARAIEADEKRRVALMEVCNKKIAKAFFEAYRSMK